MRPSLIDPFFAAITTLPGIGPKLEKLYRRLLGREDEPRIVDLLFHLPTGAIDRRARPKLSSAVRRNWQRCTPSSKPWKRQVIGPLPSR